MKRLALLFFLVTPSANATDLATAQQALNIISDFADKFCKSPPLEGGTRDVELTGKAKAELSEVLRKVANLGIEGAAKYQSDQYRGLLQQDLANVLRDSSNCRLEVWRDLKDKLLPEESKPSPHSSEEVPSTRNPTDQHALAVRAKEAEERSRRLQEAARLAKSEAEAEAAIREFTLRNPVRLNPSPAHVRTLAALLTERVVGSGNFVRFFPEILSGLVA